jgi:hypothetical protein
MPVSVGLFCLYRSLLPLWKVYFDTFAYLSEDQKPDRDDERRRILSCGGRVEPLMDENGEAIGPYRVWLPNMMLPGLAMARSIGGFFFT